MASLRQATIKAQRGAAIILPLKSMAHITRFEPTNTTPTWLTFFDEDGTIHELDSGANWENVDGKGAPDAYWKIPSSATEKLPDQDDASNVGRKVWAELTIQDDDGDYFPLCRYDVQVENNRHIDPTGEAEVKPSPFVKSTELSSAILTDNAFRPNAPIRIGNTLLADTSMTLGGNHTALIEVGGFTVSEGYKYAHLEISGRFECNIPLHVSTVGEITDSGTHVLGGISAPDYIKIGSTNGNIAVEIGHTDGFGGNLSLRLIGSGEVSQYRLITTVNGSLPNGEPLTLRTKLPGQLYVEKEAFHATSSSWTITSDGDSKDVIARLTYKSMLAFVATFEETPIWVRNGKLGTRAGGYGYSQAAQTYESAIGNLIDALPEEERTNIPADFAKEIGAVIRTPIWVDNLTDLNEVGADTAGAVPHVRLSANFDFGYMVFAAFASVSALRAKAAKAALAEAVNTATSDADKFAAIEAWANS